MTIGWIRFAAALWPDAKDLLKELYRLYKGDVDKARTVLIHIRNQGLRLDIAEAQIDARMERAREAAGKPEGSA